MVLQVWSLRSLFVLGKGPCIKMQSAAGWFLITHLASTIRHTFSPVLSAEFITPPPVPQVTWGGSLSCSWAFCHHTRHSPIDRPYLTPPFGPGISECEWCIRLPLQVAAAENMQCSAFCCGVTVACRRLVFCAFLVAACARVTAGQDGPAAEVGSSTQDSPSPKGEGDSIHPVSALHKVLVLKAISIKTLCRLPSLIPCAYLLKLSLVIWYELFTITNPPKTGRRACRQWECCQQHSLERHIRQACG